MEATHSYIEIGAGSGVVVFVLLSSKRVTLVCEERLRSIEVQFEVLVCFFYPIQTCCPLKGLLEKGFLNCRVIVGQLGAPFTHAAMFKLGGLFHILKLF